MLSLQLSNTTIALLIATILPTLFLLTIYRMRVASIAKHARKCQDSAPIEKLPPVSVIVYTCNDSDNLAQMLPNILNQQYPSDFEVIVVNDGASESTKDIVSALSATFPNLYLTYTPDDSRFLSRKKLALTLGIKAARHDYVVITKSSCRIDSLNWLKSMAQHFANGKDVVIGHASYSPADDKAFGTRSRAFNAAVDATTHLAAAIGAHPYRGFDANIAYSRKLFFDNRGFSNSLNLKFGDDDIFISEIATPSNTAVELSPDAHVTCVYRRKPKIVYRDLKMRYMFTSRHLYHGSRRLFGLASTMMWAWLLLSIAAIASSLTSLHQLIISASAVTIISLALWLPLIFTWRRTLKSLQSRPMLLTIPAYLLARPLHNFYFYLRSLATRKWNYTWQNP